jgi:signal peptidase I
MVTGAVGFALAVRTWIARPYRVLSASMLPTLEPEDTVGGRVRFYTPDRLPQRGDVIVFRSEGVPGGPRGATAPEVLVKRVIGLPGDTISMSSMTPLINGWPVPGCDVGEYLYVGHEPGDPGLHGRLRVEFLNDRAYLAVHSVGNAFEVGYVVKPGEVFVLGDNRGNSSDSRAYNGGRGGGVPAAAVQGRIEWFLAGTHLSGDIDLGRFLKPVDGLQVHLRTEGVLTGATEDAIARCLRNRPSNTRPPPP